MKTADYGKAIRYLLFQHDEHTQQPVMDEYGVPLLRESFIFDGINCDPYAYDFECHELNHVFHKKQTRDEIKQHHYIISFDPKDVAECGLTEERAQSLGMEFAKKNFPGHQVLVCTHSDGHNHSGNVHVHIVFNSLRKLDVDGRDYMERACDSRAGFKHHVTRKLLAYLKSDLMQMCQREHLHQVDLLKPARKRISEKEYYAKKRGAEKAAVDDGIAKDEPAHQTPFETQKDYLRRAIEPKILLKVTLHYSP